MDKNNLAIILNTTNLHYYKTDYYEIQNFSLSQKWSTYYLTRLHFGGWGFFRILNCEGTLYPPHISKRNKIIGLNNYLGLALLRFGRTIRRPICKSILSGPC